MVRADGGECVAGVAEKPAGKFAHHSRAPLGGDPRISGRTGGEPLPAGDARFRPEHDIRESVYDPFEP